MAFLTESLLKEKAKILKFSKYYLEEPTQAETTAFLSHSHKDKELVIGLIELFAEQGIYIYVDWNDSDIPRITNGETARKIKERIEEMDYFLFFATKNGVNSRWCPWELGIADSLKNWKNILIIPVVDPSGNFKGNEYLQIYRRIELDDNKLYIINPDSYVKYIREKIIEEILDNENKIELSSLYDFDKSYGYKRILLKDFLLKKKVEYNKTTF